MNFKYLLLLLIGVLIISCSDDDDCCDITPEDTIIHYDGDNFSAPTVLGGKYNFAVRFPASDFSRLSGQTIKSVNIFIYETPNNARLTIHGETGNIEPSALLYSQASDNLSNDQWNEIELNTPFSLTGDTFWVGLEFDVDDIAQVVGCDQGPADANGSWLYNDELDQLFIRYTERGGESVNWNIRVVVGE